MVLIHALVYSSETIKVMKRNSNFQITDTLNAARYLNFQAILKWGSYLKGVLF